MAATTSKPTPTIPAPGQRIDDRYLMEALLGRGGMACVYRVRDTRTDTHVALKLLEPRGNEHATALAISLFEREFHTLNQLAHPRVVQAFDYGVCNDSPYYTMELLDGGDLHRGAPIGWARACTAAYDLCSALSLLHYRGLVHRDLTPANVRQSVDGKTKLIDFGILTPMGATTIMAGTPPFVAPELVQRMTVDGRSDLFSLGATLYYALTGRNAFPARRMSQLDEVWRNRPAVPSSIVPNVPRALDQLVMSLLRIDPGSRPRSAAEVMERLRPLLEEAPDEELRVAGAYLTAPRLVGRADLLGRLRELILRAATKRGGGLLIRGEAGVGRTRILDAFVLEAKLAGACTVRAGAAEAAAGPFGVASSIATQLCSALPHLARDVLESQPEAAALLLDDASKPGLRIRDLSQSQSDRAALLGALRTWIIAIAARRTLAIAVDDLDLVDEPSVALLAAVLWDAPTHRLAFTGTIESGVPPTAAAALSMLEGRGTVVELPPLTRSQTTDLLRSVFGDAAHLQLLSDRLYRMSGGRPRESMALAEHLVEQGSATYGGGHWHLPARLDGEILPADMADALQQRVAILGPWPRRIALLLALGILERLERAALLKVDGADASAIDSALAELQSAGMLTGGPSGYALGHRALSRILVDSATEKERAQQHDELARQFSEAKRSCIVLAYHLLQGSKPEQGLDLLLSELARRNGRAIVSETAIMDVQGKAIAKTTGLALEVAKLYPRTPNQMQALWSLSATMAARGQNAERNYYTLPDAWLMQLTSASGHDDWCALSPTMEPRARAIQAMELASRRYAATAEAERLAPPEEALPYLIFYVVASIAVGVRAIDLELLATLPRLLEPFVTVSDLAHTMWNNARITVTNNLGQRELARDGFAELQDQMQTLAKTDDSGYLHKVRSAVRQTMFEIDASLGVQPSETDTELEYRDPAQLVGAEYMRKVAALHRGDWERAEEHRQRAELIALQNRSAAMFSTLGQELEAHALARDLTGLSTVRQGVQVMAGRHPRWVSVAQVANAYYAYLCGEQQEALDAVSELLAEAAEAPIPSPWRMHGRLLRIEILIERGEAEQALSEGRAALVECERGQLHHMARILECPVALAESATGDHAKALERIAALSEVQRSKGITGLLLGRTYEYGCRVAIAARDASSFEHYAELTATQYRPGESSVLGGLYERLMEAARHAEVMGLRADSEGATRDGLPQSSINDHVSTALSTCVGIDEYAQRALALLCQGSPPRGGYFFLLTDSGLKVSASNETCDDIEQMREFAQRCLEPDSDHTLHAITVTGGLDSADEGGTTEWLDQAGTRYRPILLGTAAGGRWRQLGVAIVTIQEGDDLREVLPVASAVARTLWRSGIFAADTKGTPPDSDADNAGQEDIGNV